MAQLEVNNLTKVYDNEGEGTRALSGVSLVVEQGDFVAIMGPSGSGKSTLLHLLGLLDKPTEGTYLFEGTSIERFTDDALAMVRNKKLGFVFQAFNLLGHMTVKENVILPLLYSNVPEHEWSARATQVIASVGLAHREDHEASRLSGGEKQRASIARALINDPSIIFADEPTGNLDSKSGGVVMETLARLNEEEGRTIILVTHESYAARYAQRVITLRDWRIETDTKVTQRTVKGYTK